MIVGQNPCDYTFELGVDYQGNDLNGMPIAKSPAQPKTENTVSINDVLATLETNEIGTNFAVFGAAYSGDASPNKSDFKNFSWYKNSMLCCHKNQCQLKQIRNYVSNTLVDINDDCMRYN